MASATSAAGPDIVPASDAAGGGGGGCVVLLRYDSMEPLVARLTLCKNALCLAATSGSLSLEEARLAPEKTLLQHTQQKKKFQGY